MGRQSYFITHLVNMFNVDDVIRRNNAFIKKRFFERVIDNRVRGHRVRGQVPEPYSDWTDVRRRTGEGSAFD